jgi:hypothetical protein
MAKEKKEENGNENGVTREKNIPVSKSTKQKVYFNFSMAQLPALERAFRKKHGQKLDPETVLTGDVHTLVFNPLCPSCGTEVWKVEGIRGPSMSAEDKALLSAIKSATPEQKAKLKKEYLKQ